MVLTACGKTEEKKESPKTEQTDKQEDSTESSEAKDEDSQSAAGAPVVQEPSNDTGSSNESTSNKNETTTKPSTGNTDSNKKPSTGATTKPSTGSTGNTQNNNSGTTTKPSTPVHEHKWTEIVEDEIHYYAWRTICNVCNADLTDMEEDEWAYHVVVICGGSYATYYKEVDFVTENVVKTPVVTGYKCECGAEKK